MPRPTTVVRVHDAVLELAATGGSLTMEGIAVQAGVSKQTLYRSWPSVPAIIFDALFARDTHVAETLPSTGDLQRDLVALLEEAVVEISTQPRESLLRSLAARIQTDESTASEFHDRLLRPQLDVVHTLLRSGGARRVERTAELLLAPVFYRWFMRLTPMTSEDIASHVREVLRLTREP